MTARAGPGSLRRRLAACLVAMAVGALVAAVFLTAALARSTARADARHDLADAAGGLSDLVAGGVGNLANLSRRLGRVMDVDGVGVALATPQGRIVGDPLAPRPRRRDALLPRAPAAGLPALPPGVEVSDLDGARLWAGADQAGGRGRLVFVAHPLEPLAGRSLRPVIVLTRTVGVFPLGRGGPFLLLAAALAAGVASAVAVWLAGRLTRPLEAMERTTRAIAGGDLGARVGGLAEADDELARLGAAIDAMAGELERSAGLERAFLMSVSHDLRTPLTSIRGWAEAVAEGAAGDDEARRRAATIIGAEARRLDRLVADLLDLARLDAREFSLHPRPVDAASVVGGAVDALQPAASDAGVRLTAVPVPAPLPATLDPERLAQIVANLVENAVKYAATAVEVGVAAVPAGIRVTVDDDGPGVDPADLPHVFERLYTSRRPAAAPPGPATPDAGSPAGATPGAGPRAGRKVGTGLGLAIVAQLTRAMGGTVEVGRAPDGRTRFTLVVSGAAPPSGPSGSSSSSGASSSSSASSWSSPTGPS